VSHAAEFDACIRAGGVALFPADTVYGLACDPDNAAAVARLYEIKRRPPEKAAAVMFFMLDRALGALPPLGPRVLGAIEELLPGGVTLLLENRTRRFPLTCAGDPATLGLRVVDVPSLAGAEVAVLQSSANPSGGPAPRQLGDTDDLILAGADLVIDGGELPGLSSTVVDLRRYEEGEWSVIRPGAVSTVELEAQLGASDGR
jgi:L-threonylcarbamoyladenylate synthase